MVRDVWDSKFQTPLPPVTYLPKKKKKNTFNILVSSEKVMFLRLILLLS